MRTEMLRHLGGFTTPETAPGTAATRRSLLGLTVSADTISRPPEFSWHDYAVFLLSMAAEIEHSLMVQYLYAAWSLGGPAVPAAHQADVLKWQRIILGIAKEEMGHLITVQNVLRLLGGAVHLDREDYPWVSGFYPYAFSLEPASPHSPLSFKEFENMSCQGCNRYDRIAISRHKIAASAVDFNIDTGQTAFKRGPATPQ